jgi:hypothetical protein
MMRVIAGRQISPRGLDDVLFLIHVLRAERRVRACGLPDQARLYSFYFLVEQHLESLGRLRSVLDLLTQKLPGARIPACAGANAAGSSSSSKGAKGSAAGPAELRAHAAREAAVPE